LRQPRCPYALKLANAEASVNPALDPAIKGKLLLQHCNIDLSGFSDDS
jgi:hypothetical protein